MHRQRPGLTRLLTASLLLLSVPSGKCLLRGQSQCRISGTFTNMHYIADAGDVIGYELRVVPAGEAKYQAALQIAEGAPSKLMLVDIQAKECNISFAISDVYGVYAGTFKGAVANNTLKGEFTFKSGGVDKVELKRGKSYWD